MKKKYLDFEKELSLIEDEVARYIALKSFMQSLTGDELREWQQQDRERQGISAIKNPKSEYSPAFWADLEEEMKRLDEVAKQAQLFVAQRKAA
jgi:hypothetical protein